MRRNRKIWLGLGAFILTTGAVNANDIQQLEPAVEGKINGKAAPSIPFAQTTMDLSNVWAQAGEGGRAAKVAKAVSIPRRWVTTRQSTRLRCR